MRRGLRALFHCIYLIWLPMKAPHDADALAGELLNAGVKKLLLLVLDVGRAPGAPPERLSAAGLLVINPPFGFAGAMESALNALAPLLAQGEGPPPASNGSQVANDEAVARTAAMQDDAADLAGVPLMTVLVHAETCSPSRANSLPRQTVQSTTAALPR